MGVFLKVLFTLSLGLGASFAFADSENIRIEDPWVQAAPPNVKVLAAYLKVSNHGEKPETLVNVTSPVFKQVGIHRSVMHGNMAHMEHLKELTIPPHASATLEPGGLHLMLMDAKKPLQVGDSVPMTLSFKNGSKVAVTATVRSGQMAGMEDHQHMDHSEHMNHGH